MSKRVHVDVKSAYQSKINWTQIVGIGASILTVATAGHYDLPAEQQVMLVCAIQSTQALATWVMRTWFTTSVTPASLGDS